MGQARYVAICTLAMLASWSQPSPAASADSRIEWRSGTRQVRSQSSDEAASRVARLVPAAGERHLIVQFSQPLDLSERVGCRDAGLRLLEYLGDNAYFASISDSGVDQQALATLTPLVESRAIARNWKLHPFLAEGREPAWAIVGSDDTGGAVVAVYILFHSDVSLDSVGSELVIRHGAAIRAQIRSLNGLVIELPLSRIGELADEDGVQYIEPALPKLDGLNDSNRQLVGADIAQSLPYDLDGSGVTAMIYDVGGAASAGGIVHPDVSGRLSLMDTSPISGHSSHVSCTVGGDGSQSAGVRRGMAPAVTLLSYGFQGDPTGTFLYSNPGDLEADYSDAINLQSADISNNSIGTNICSNGFPCEITGDYGVTSALIDAIVRGSLGTPFLSVWANGNERNCASCPLEHVNGYHSTAPPAGAKNHITVGAVNSNDDSMTAFSSWGPTDDGRLKPDLVAPGCQTDADLGVTSCNTDFGVFGYTVLCGTSMAAPTVTGIASLLLQDFRAQFPGLPRFRNSTLKVLLTHNAQDIATVGPDYQTGYGSVRILPTIEFMRTGAFLEDEVAHGETFSIVVPVAPGTPQLKATLAWDDVPGTPNVGVALVNDLDLRIVGPASTVHFPWTLDPANPAAPAVRTQPDSLNNIEQVAIDNPPAGDYRIEVVGSNVPSTPQSFSLAAPGIVVELGGHIALLPDAAAAPYGSPFTLDAVVTDGRPPFDPIPGATVDFEVFAGPNTGLNGMGTTDANGIVSFTYSTGILGIDQVRASFTDALGVHVSSPAEVDWVPGIVTLSPTTATKIECASHSLTATVTQGAFPFAPLAGVSVNIDVLSGPNAGAGIQQNADIDGELFFTYFGAPGAGTDTIQASFVDASQVQLSVPVTATWQASSLDCNLNGLADQCEAGWNQDCNGNGGPDLCDLSAVVGFDPPVGLTVDASPFAIAAAELDGLAGIDLVTASGANPTISVLINNADGSFASAVDYPTDKPSASISLADLDGDGDIDAAAATQNDTVSILLNNGDGTFAPGGDFPTLGSRPVSIVSADVDGIAGPDLIVAHRDQNGLGAFTVTVLLNNGDATFQPAASYSVGDTPEAVVSEDFDGINGPDLAVANKQSDSISVLLNNGDGTFGAAANLVIGDAPVAVAAGDLDGDQDADLAVVQSGSNRVRILLNNGSGVFSFGPSLLVDTGPVAIVAVDLESDGDRDLAVVTSGTLAAPTGIISVLLNLGNAVFTPAFQLPAGALSPVAITTADFDGNGDADLALAHALTTGTTSISLGRVAFFSRDTDLNGVPDECDVAAGGSGWIFSGVGEGGTVEAVVNGVPVSVSTTLGQSAESIAMALAAAINADPTLMAEGVGALVDARTVTTNGVISSTTITDPGITYADASTPVPSLSRLGFVLLVMSVLWMTLHIGQRSSRRKEYR